MHELRYDKIKEILNSTLFEKGTRDLIKSLATNPDRFVGLFRYTSAEAKLMQFIFQSREIKFGNALERIVQHIVFDLFGWSSLERKIDEDLYCDHLGRKGSILLLIEQKVRDDHDSSKKRGQVLNFERKIERLLIRQSDFHTEKIWGIFYFIDPSLTKNKNYYQAEVRRMEEQNKPLLELSVLYGGELFSYLEPEKGGRYGISFAHI